MNTLIYKCTKFVCIPREMSVDVPGFQTSYFLRCNEDEGLISTASNICTDVIAFKFLRKETPKKSTKNLFCFLEKLYIIPLKIHYQIPQNLNEAIFLSASNC